MKTKEVVPLQSLENVVTIGDWIQGIPDVHQGQQWPFTFKCAFIQLLEQLACLKSCVHLIKSKKSKPEVVRCISEAPAPARPWMAASNGQ